MSVSRRWIVALQMLAAFAAMLPARAQDYPSQPVRIIVPFGPGSGSDIVARRFGAYLQELWKQPVVIDNRAGAQGLIGTEALRGAPPDGYTLGISTNSTHAAAALLFRKVPYDALRDFEHIALIGTGGSVALVPKDSPFKTIAQLAAYAKAHPGKVLFGHADTSSQVPAALLQARGDLPLEGIPYKAAAGIVTDLIGGQIQLAFFNSMTGAAQVAGGRLVPIAITESKRHRAWPGVPTVAETYPGYEVSFFVGVSAPRGVPAGVIAAIRRAVAQAQAHPSVRAPLENMGLTLVAQRAGDYHRFIGAETERWRTYVKAAGLTPQ